MSALLALVSVLVVVMVAVITFLIIDGTSRKPLVEPGQAIPAPTLPRADTLDFPPEASGVPDAIARASDGPLSLIAYQTPEDDIRFSLYDGEQVVSQPDLALSSGTTVSGLRLTALDGRDVALFEARDDTWETRYVWDTAANRLHYRARRIGQSQARFSDAIPQGGAIASHLGFSAPPTPAPVVRPPSPPRTPPTLRVERQGATQRVVVARGTQVVVRLDQSYDTTTQISGLTFETVAGRSMAVFTAQDDDWRTRYAWDTDRGTLYWRAASRSSGTVNRSGSAKANTAVDQYLSSTL